MDALNRNRLEESRQLRKEIRHSEKYLIMGIDMAKNRHYAFFGDSDGGNSPNGDELEDES